MQVLPMENEPSIPQAEPEGDVLFDLTDEMIQERINVINDVCSEVLDERVNQEEKWGLQDRRLHYSADGPYRWERGAESWKAINDEREKRGAVTWDGVLLEEVYEALGAPTLQDARAELIQVAAVAAAMVENIDRHEAPHCPATGEPCVFGCLSVCASTKEAL